MIKEAINKVVNKTDLTFEEATQVMKEIMSGQATPAQISCLLTALRMKGETSDEIAGFAKTMREFVTRINVDLSKPLLDTCGTGGDSSGTFNISTVSSFVIAGAGVRIAKHGNRSVTSNCGSADIFEKLGIKLDAKPEVLEKCLEEVGMVFLFAPSLHPAMKYAIGPRKEIGIRTVFNILGPLTNPAFANCQILGVYSPSIIDTIAESLLKLNIKHAFIFHGDGLDEITITGETSVTEVHNNKIKKFKISPEKYGIKRTSKDMLKGEDVQTNVEILYNILKGEKGPKRDVVILNSAFGIVAAGKAKKIEEGIKIAIDSIDSGKALKKLNQLIEFYRNI